jgi:hypothetical protein
MSRSKVVDILARVAANRGQDDLAGGLCVYRDRLAHAEKLAEDAVEQFQRSVVDRMSPSVKEKYIQEQKDALERMRARLVQYQTEKDPQKKPSQSAVDSLKQNIDAVEKGLARAGGE